MCFVVAKTLLTFLTMSFIINVTFGTSPPIRIVNGFASNISLTPYFIQLRSPRDGGAFCGGALVTQRHVVTAAHCIGTFKNDQVLVFGGSAMKYGKSGVKRRIETVTVHPNYSSHTMNNDVAVVKLTKPMVGVNIKTVKLCSSELKPFDYLMVSGFGWTNANEGGSDYLRSVKLFVMSRESCRKRHLNLITDAMLCTHTFHQDACEGDSGGPGVFDGQLCGIVSWGGKCGENLLPGVYTNVFGVRDFIENCIKS